MKHFFFSILGGEFYLIAYDKFVEELNQKYGDIVKWSLFSHKEVLKNIEQCL